MQPAKIPPIGPAVPARRINASSNCSPMYFLFKQFSDEFNQNKSLHNISVDGIQKHMKNKVK